MENSIGGVRIRLGAAAIGIESGFGSRRRPVVELQ